MGLDTLLNDIARMTRHSDASGNKLSRLLALWGMAQFPYGANNHFYG